MRASFHTCPMHPEIRQAQPGICLECGMNLVPAKETKELDVRDKHAGHSTRIFVRKFWVSLALTIPVVLYSDLTAELFGWSPPPFPGSAYIPLVLGSSVFFYGGLVFLRGALRELQARQPGMMTLIALAVAVAYLWSVGVVLLGLKGDLFWELTTLITVMLLGHWMEMRAVAGAQGALKELSKLLPDRAERVLADGKAEVVALSELKVDDIVLVRPGGKIPADGIVVEGKSEVNEAMVTGESKPIGKIPGSEVIAGTVNGDGSLKVRVTNIGEHTFLAGVMRLVQETQASKSRLQLLADRAAYWLTIIAVSAGAFTFLTWIAAKADFPFALERLVAVLVIACPHALGLAIPLVASISTTLAARHGFLVRLRLALESARNIDIVLFDKTGTLTKGEYGVDAIITNDQLSMTNDQLLQLAASVDAHSEHFIAQAVVAEARKRGVALQAVKDFERIPGKGVRGIVDGALVLVGGEAILSEVNVDVPEALKPEIVRLAKQGKTIIYVVSQRQLLGMIALADIIRDESREAVRALKDLGVKVAMVTGDSDDVAKWVAAELGINIYFARVLPADKARIIKELQEGRFRNSGLEIRNSSRRLAVAMVGDGINDAPALVQADVGIAIGAGTNVAIESAGIILVRNDPRDIVRIIKLSRATYTKMLQNLFWATGYNVVALPLAAGALAFQGIVLQPALAALFMSLSTVIVAVNALLLRRML